MRKSKHKNILSEFDSKVDLFDGFSAKLNVLLRELVHSDQVQVQSVATRVKSRTSLEGKLARKGAYSTCADITDLVGARVITYFNDDVNAICRIIEREFTIDQKNSVDKRLALDSDRFGYLSVHYVVQLSEPRCNLLEWKRFSGIKAEIQVRSVLQHAWAEIEHDLGYKAGSELPKSLKRRFSRLAGLLELADEEFVALRGSIAEYTKSVEAKLRGKPADVSLDSTSLVLFVTGNRVPLELDHSIATADNSTLSDQPSGRLDEWIRELKRLGIVSIGALEAELVKHRDRIVRLAHQWSEEEEGRYLRGICVFFALYFINAERGGKDAVLDYLTREDITGLDGESPEDIATDVMACFHAPKR